MLLSHFPPCLVLLIMIRSHFMRSPWPLVILPIGLCFNGNRFNYYNYYYQRHRTGSRIYYNNTDKRISTKVKDRRFGIQLSIFCVHGDLGRICSSHRFIRYNITLILVYSAPPVSFIFMECLIAINVRIHNFLIGWENSWSYVCLKILGHIASSDYLSDGSRKDCNGLTKTSWNQTCSTAVALTRAHRQ